MTASTTVRPIRLGAALPLLIGGAVAVAIGVYGKVHDPTGRSIVTFGFSETPRMKNWLATATVVLMVGQVVTALRIYGRLVPHRPTPSWLGDVHRLLGTLAFAASLPVVFHCLWSLGYSTVTTRVAIHSLLGCAAYGAFAAKVVAVRRSDQPGWMLPAIGATLAMLLVGVWWSSALWWFTNVSWGV